MERECIGTSGGRDEHPIRCAPAELRTDFEREGLLSLDAKEIVGLRCVEEVVALRDRCRERDSFEHIAGDDVEMLLRDEPVEKIRRGGVVADEAVKLEARGCRVARKRAREIARRGDGQPAMPDLAALADGDARATVLERSGRVPGFVLQVEALETERLAEAAIVQQRRTAFVERTHLGRIPHRQERPPAAHSSAAVEGIAIERSTGRIEVVDRLEYPAGLGADRITRRIVDERRVRCTRASIAKQKRILKRVHLIDSFRGWRGLPKSSRIDPNPSIPAPMHLSLLYIPSILSATRTNAPLQRAAVPRQRLEPRLRLEPRTTHRSVPTGALDPRPHAQQRRRHLGRDSSGC